MHVPTISPQRLAALRQAGQRGQLIDVRTPVEFRELHVAGARNLPLEKLDTEVMHGPAGADQTPLYVICRSGSRGRQACERLLAAGCDSVFNVEGGTLACVAAGLPVVRGRQAVSLERQVRIAAGSLVLVSILLAWLVHPAFAGLAAFVGAGLVFAGVTDTCGMGLVLARMPWNQVQEPPTTCVVR